MHNNNERDTIQPRWSLLSQQRVHGEASHIISTVEHSRDTHDFLSACHALRRATEGTQLRAIEPVLSAMVDIKSARGSAASSIPDATLERLLALEQLLRAMTEDEMDSAGMQALSLEFEVRPEEMPFMAEQNRKHVFAHLTHTANNLKLLLAQLEERPTSPPADTAMPLPNGAPKSHHPRPDLQLSEQP